MNEYEVDPATLRAAATAHRQALGANGARGFRLDSPDDYGHPLVDVAADDFVERWTADVARLVQVTDQIAAELDHAADFYVDAEDAAGAGYDRAGRRRQVPR